MRIKKKDPTSVKRGPNFVINMETKGYKDKSKYSRKDKHKKTEGS